MSKTRMCIICGKNPATIPDRDTMSSIPKICRECHIKRLRGDMAIIIKSRETKEVAE